MPTASATGHAQAVGVVAVAGNHAMAGVIGTAFQNGQRLPLGLLQAARYRPTKATVAADDQAPSGGRCTSSNAFAASQPGEDFTQPQRGPAPAIPAPANRQNLERIDDGDRRRHDAMFAATCCRSVRASTGISGCSSRTAMAMFEIAAIVVGQRQHAATCGWRSPASNRLASCARRQPAPGCRS